MKLLRVTTLLSFCAAAACIFGQVQPIVTVRPTSEITGDRILLGDIAEITADAATTARLREVFLGETPVLGLRRLITRSSLVTRLLAAGEKPDRMTIIVPEDARAFRKGQTVAGESMVDSARTYVQRQLGFEVNLVEKDVVRDALVPVGALELVPVSVGDAAPVFSVTLSIRVEGKLVATRTIKLQADASQGVKQGQDVKLRIRSSGAVVELSGKAKANAVIGQTVQVTTDRKTTHTGRVIAPGLVEVSI